MNPYKVLDITPSATKHEIIQAVAKALRERKFSSRDAALAQKELLNPITRAVDEFLYVFDVKPLQGPLKLTPPKEQSELQLNRLSIFDKGP